MVGVELEGMDRVDLVMRLKRKAGKEEGEREGEGGREGERASTQRPAATQPSLGFLSL